ncbi:MAG: SDR family oxidoreductase [Halieaceae bacterium]|jgi:NAD(P)-dependent dehydrogenase (short-subunit alcohol dehydrogenase family)|nr:SDR family oxidoreductase [Halieaceae bacterium]
MANPVAFITGASRGIGAETAVALARDGYDVGITARSLNDGEVFDHNGILAPLPGSLHATAAKVEAYGRRALCLKADILDEKGTVDALRQTQETFGRIDVLFNNATYQGIGNMEPVLELTREHFDAIYQANIFSPLALIKTAIPLMQQQGGGTIINMLSATAFTDPPAPPSAGGWGFAYASSKAALGRLAGCLLAEHAGAGLRIFNTEPGTVITEVMKQAGIAEMILKYANPCPAVAVAEVIARLCQRDPEPDWLSDGVLHLPAIARELNLLDAPSLLDESLETGHGGD